MKKILLKAAFFIATFIISVIVSMKIINKGHESMTIEMSSPTLPTVVMTYAGHEYNKLFGYTEEMAIPFVFTEKTILPSTRELSFNINPYKANITGMEVEIRTTDGTRLIEKTEITDYSKVNDKYQVNITLKDLLEKENEYSLTIVLALNDRTEAYYYTRIMLSDDCNFTEKLEFVQNFHEKLYNKDASKELTKYLESNSKLESNTSFHNVNIHSSFKQVTWGDLNVTETKAADYYLTAMAKQTASFLVKYQVASVNDKKIIYYSVEEYYRIRYTDDRTYLLDYNRTMTQIPDEKSMYANDKILLGITDENVDMVESEDGSVLVFVDNNKLFSYNMLTNKLSVIFAFYNDENKDERCINNNHSIKILNIEEGGNVWFAVYGYMNRGRYEGRVGLQVYCYDSEINCYEESLYIEYDKPYSMLKSELSKLLYMNKDKQLIFALNGFVYQVDLSEKGAERLFEIEHDEALLVSYNNKVIAWQQGGDKYDSAALYIKNLNQPEEIMINVSEDDAILPFGFMDEDVIYGVAHKSDIIYTSGEVTLFPMYKLCIVSSEGALLKEYSQDNIYISECSFEDNQIYLSRLIKKEDGTYENYPGDQIMDNSEPAQMINEVVCADIDTYERYVQIKLKKEIDTKSIKILTPKEVLYEGARSIKLEGVNHLSKYYVSLGGSIEGIYFSPALAVDIAYNKAAEVYDEYGKSIWIKGNRLTRNQIMAIKAPATEDERNSISVCLDTVLSYEGISVNTSYLLDRGMSVNGILEEYIDGHVLNLTGCKLDAVLYYVNRDLPVFALLNDGECVLITGFNDYNTVIFDPSTGALYKKGMNDSKEWFEENTNHFITYVRNN